jgi:hypothetical protein
MIAYLAPLVAVILGVTILGEQLGWNAYLGCGLILLGVMAVNGLFAGWRPAPAEERNAQIIDGAVNFKTKESLLP